MPRTTAAKQWQPDAFAEDTINKFSQFVVVAERSAAYLRSLNLSYADVEHRWASVQKEFYNDPVKYPSIMASNDEGRKRFNAKCQEICFPANPPCNPEDYILMIFAAQGAMQSMMHHLDTHEYLGEISHRANLQALKALGYEATYNTATELDHNLHDKPQLYEEIRCRDGLGKVMEYTVVDCGISAVHGDYVILEDNQGATRQVSLPELHEMRVG